MLEKQPLSEKLQNLPTVTYEKIQLLIRTVLESPNYVRAQLIGAILIALNACAPVENASAKDANQPDKAGQPTQVTNGITPTPEAQTKVRQVSKLAVTPTPTEKNNSTNPITNTKEVTSVTELQRFVTITDARTFRSGPSKASAPVHYPTGAKVTTPETTTPGQNFRFFTRETQSDGTVWLRLTDPADKKQLPVYIAFVYPGLPKPEIHEIEVTIPMASSEKPGTGGAELTSEVKQKVLADVNAISTTTGISVDEVIQTPEGILIKNKGVVVAIILPNPTTGEPTLWSIDGNGSPSKQIAVINSTGGWTGINTQEQTVSNTSVEAKPSNEKSYIRSLFPANLEEYFAEKEKKVIYDEKYNLFFSVDKNTGEKFALIPHSAAAGPENDLAVAEAFFDPATSCLSSDAVSPNNPSGVERKICMFAGRNHLVVDGPFSFHPDLLANQDLIMKMAAEYLLLPSRIDTTPFTIYINLPSDQLKDYKERDFEDVSPSNGQDSKYEKWGVPSIAVIENPHARIDIIDPDGVKGFRIIFNMFTNIPGESDSVLRAKADIILYVIGGPFFQDGLSLSHDLLRRKSTGDFSTLTNFMHEMKALKKDKNTDIYAQKAKPNYLDLFR